MNITTKHTTNLMVNTEAQIKQPKLKISYKKIGKDQFKQLYKQHYESVFNHLYFCSNDYELSNDITQETFLKLWNKRDTIQDKESILPFIIRIGRNLLTDYYRRKKTEGNYVTHETLNGKSYDTIESQVNANILEEKIRETIKRHLKNKTSTIFIMSRFEGKSNDEISATLGIAKKTVENQISKASSILKSKLKHYLGE